MKWTCGDAISKSRFKYEPWRTLTCHNEVNHLRNMSLLIIAVFKFFNVYFFFNNLNVHVSWVNSGMLFLPFILTISQLFCSSLLLLFFLWTITFLKSKNQNLQVSILWLTLHKNWSFPLSISSVNVTKFADYWKLLFVSCVTRVSMTIKIIPSYHKVFYIFSKIHRETKNVNLLG